MQKYDVRVLYFADGYITVILLRLRGAAGCV